MIPTTPAVISAYTRFVYPHTVYATHLPTPTRTHPYGRICILDDTYNCVHDDSVSSLKHAIRRKYVIMIIIVDVV
jgi:hypothetical protein